MVLLTVSEMSPQTRAAVPAQPPPTAARNSPHARPARPAPARRDAAPGFFGEENVPAPHARVVSSTIEMVGTDRPIDVAVIDDDLGRSVGRGRKAARR